MNFSSKTVFLLVALVFSLTNSYSQTFEQFLQEASDSISENKLGPQTFALIEDAAKLVEPGTKEESMVILQKGIYYFNK